MPNTFLGLLIFNFSSYLVASIQEFLLILAEVAYKFLLPQSLNFLRMLKDVTGID